MYQLKFLPPAEKYLKKLREKGLRLAYKNALDKISADPYSGELKTGDLAGIYSVNVFYNRINYELAYYIYEEEDQIVVVILAGTRENFYNELKRYMK